MNYWIEIDHDAVFGWTVRLKRDFTKASEELEELTSTGSVMQSVQRCCSWADVVGYVRASRWRQLVEHGKCV